MLEYEPVTPPDQATPPDLPTSAAGTQEEAGQ
jgi:hypothetical protein